MILRYVPYVQTNFVLGLDGDEGPEPFALTKRFVDLTPGAFPGYSLLTAFGQAARLNLDYQRTNRGAALPVPRPEQPGDERAAKHYTWPDFYARDRSDPVHFFMARDSQPLWRDQRHDPAVDERGASRIPEGFGRLKYHTEVRRRLGTDAQLRRYFDQETTEIPQFYMDLARKDLGAME